MLCQRWKLAPGKFHAEVAQMPTRKCNSNPPTNSLPALRFDIAEAAQILRMSRAQLYNRICEGTIKSQKDGARTYITARVDVPFEIASGDVGPGPVLLRPGWFFQAP